MFIDINHRVVMGSILNILFYTWKEQPCTTIIKLVLITTLIGWEISSTLIIVMNGCYALFYTWNINFSVILLEGNTLIAITGHWMSTSGRYPVEYYRYVVRLLSKQWSLHYNTV